MIYNKQDIACIGTEVIIMTYIKTLRKKHRNLLRATVVERLVVKDVKFVIFQINPTVGVWIAGSKRELRNVGGLGPEAETLSIYHQGYANKLDQPCETSSDESNIRLHRCWRFLFRARV